MLKNIRIALSYQNKNKYEVYCLKNNIQTYPAASYSVILSGAAYIVYEFPNLPHPRKPQLKLPHKRHDTQYPSPYLSLHPLFDQWVQVLAQSFFLGNAIRQNDTLFVKVNVCKQFANVLKEMETPCEQFDKDMNVSQIFKLNSIHKQKRVGWINCSGSQIHRKTFEPSINVPGIVLGQIYNNQKYDIFNILKGEIPTSQQLTTYDTIIIPGSSLSVLSHVNQIVKLSKNIYQAYKKSEKLKILGICYGQQLISQIYGSKIIKRKRCAGLQVIKFNKQIINKFDFLEPLLKYKKTELSLSQHHQDNVTTVPQGFLQLGISNSCQNQTLVSENGRIFCTQFHPEYNYIFTKAYSARVNIYYNDQMQSKPTCNHSKQIIQQHLQSCFVIRQCELKFI